jgi:hypothetical protein
MFSFYSTLNFCMCILARLGNNETPNAKDGMGLMLMCVRRQTYCPSAGYLRRRERPEAAGFCQAAV